MKIQNKQFYDKDFNKQDYKAAQIRRHKVKVNKKRDESHYLRCTEEIINIIPDNANAICIGTRNNHERDVIKKGMGSKKSNVYSLDISPFSGADYIMDFNSLPEEWKCKWDLIFSNSIDHAVDATATFFHWLDKLKVGGIMVIGFGFNPTLTEADCCTFDEEQVSIFFKTLKEVKICSIINDSYKYYVLEKVKNV